MNAREKTTGNTIDRKKGHPASKASLPRRSHHANSPVDQILHLQRTIGNRAVQRLIKSGTPSGRKLLAHELTHVVQQQGGTTNTVRRHTPEGTFEKHPSEKRKIKARTRWQNLDEKEIKTAIAFNKKLYQFKRSIKAIARSVGLPNVREFNKIMILGIAQYQQRFHLRVDGQVGWNTLRHMALRLIRGISRKDHYNAIGDAIWLVVDGLGLNVAKVKSIIYAPKQAADFKVLDNGISVRLGTRALRSYNAFVSALKGSLGQVKKTIRSPFPEMKSSLLNSFFKDLNMTLKKLFPTTHTLHFHDFKLINPGEWAKMMSKSQEDDDKMDYNASKRQATEICSAHTRTARAELCRNDKNPSNCQRDVRDIQSNKNWCNGVNPTNELIAVYITTRGLTRSPGSSQVIREYNINPQLFLFVHEGLHRAAGKHWQNRSSTKRGFTHSKRKNQRIYAIQPWLNEGLIQIMAKRVVASMQLIKGRNWFKGFTPTSYQKEISKVQKFFGNRHKTLKGSTITLNFLINAFFKGDMQDIEEIQYFHPH